MNKGFRVSWESLKDGLLTSHYFPLNNMFSTQPEALDWANRVASVTYGEYVNFYVMDENGIPITEIIKNR